MKDLLPRALTAVVFVVVVLAALLWNRWSFYTLVIIIQTGCLYEYLRLIRHFQDYLPGKQVISHGLTLTASVLLHGLIILEGSVDSFAILYLLLLFPFTIVLFATELFLKSPQPVVNGSLNAAGLWYVAAPMACMYFMVTTPLFAEKQDWYPYLSSLPLGFILLVWANDTFAYFGGSLFGKRKILPAVSPNKSWEGFLSGLVCCLLCGYLLSLFYERLPLLDWMVIAAIVPVAGTLGDFFKSSIKRNAGVKDSGRILPGHGGFLDRFDAFLFCLPLVNLYLLLRQ